METEAIEHLTPKELTKLYFNIDLLPSQERILNTILGKTKKRIIINSLTRYGKSMSVSIAVLLFAILNPGTRNIIISPTYKQARIIMEYIGFYISESPVVAGFIDFEATGISRLKKEVTKERITLINGSDIRILSAEGKGERLMGFGATGVLIEDETGLTSDEVYRLRIVRMVEGDAIHVEIGNPFPGNHFEDNWKSERWYKIHITWKDAVAEGHPNITEEDIEEKRSILVPMEFTILYDAEFPTETEDALFKWAWIQNALNAEFQDVVNKKVMGVDVAEGGRDLSVVTIVEITKEKNYRVTFIKDWHEADTEITVDNIKEIAIAQGIQHIQVDAIGVGKGVADGLVKKGFKVVQVKVGESPTREKWRFLNKKAQYYWYLRTLFEEGRISIPQNHNLIHQLRQMRFELTAGGKTRIIDPEDKSPDFSDSLYLACADTFVGRILV